MNDKVRLARPSFAFAHYGDSSKIGSDRLGVGEEIGDGAEPSAKRQRLAAICGRR